jgi:hypothetical protein
VAEILIGAAVSVLTGFGLWAVLPRGVVLTRSERSDAYDTWELRNDSPLPVMIRSVTVVGVATYDDETGKFADVEMPAVIEGVHFHGAALEFVDDVLNITRMDRQQPWRGQVVPPGDRLEARVLANTTLRIMYRRAGRLGVFERREITIDGPP